VRNLAEHQGPGGKIIGMAKPAQVAHLDAGMPVSL